MRPSVCSGRGSALADGLRPHGAAAPRSAGLPPPPTAPAADTQPRAQRRSSLSRPMLPFKTNQAFHVRDFPTPHLANRGPSPTSRARFASARSYRKPPRLRSAPARGRQALRGGPHTAARAPRRSAPPPRRAPGSPRPPSSARPYGGAGTPHAAPPRPPLPASAAAAPLPLWPRSAGGQCQPRPDVSPPRRPGWAATRGRGDAVPHGHGLAAGRGGRAVPGSVPASRVCSRAPSDQDAEAVFPYLSSVE